MKVLSLIEPWGTLIKEEKKLIETRSWKTNYRGTLYIHTSLKKVSKAVQDNKELMNLISNPNFKYGYIICKCELVDCIYMTEEFVKDIKNNNHQEYICGTYEVGRYAWILNNIEKIDPIKAKGKLGIWTYDKEKEEEK